MIAPSVGDVLAGKYQLTRVVGRGGMGIVFEAKQLDLARSVAVKVLVLDDQARLDRFQREVSILARISHPHIVPVFDFSRGDGKTLPFLVMELLRGQTLSDLTASAGRLEPERAVRIVMQLLEALAAAHAQGIVHRDIKPANVFCVETHLAGDFVKLLDFGVAKDTAASTMLTATGALPGTLTYTAPEVLRGGPASYASDVYAVGATLYFALTNKSPFRRETTMEIVEAIARGDVERVDRVRTDISSALASIVHRALDVSPAARFQSVAAMHDALAAVAISPSVRDVSHLDVTKSGPAARSSVSVGALLIAIVVAVALATTFVVVMVQRRARPLPIASISTAPIVSATITASAASVVASTALPVVSSVAVSAAPPPTSRLRYSGKSGRYSGIDASDCAEQTKAWSVHDYAERLRATSFSKCFADAMYDPPYHASVYYSVHLSGDAYTVIEPTMPGTCPSRLTACLAAIIRTVPVQRGEAPSPCAVKIIFRADCPSPAKETEPHACP